MRVLYKRTFLKDLESLPSDARDAVYDEAFEVIPALSTIAGVEHIRKLSGYKNFYRIRMGSYRIGIELRGDTVAFYRVLHRREIYRYFP
ncbi:MAG: type II toxin-antitoxin system RelE/ParE family toxin [Bacteroidetes bacterium]|nr:type II toxin-antitoxin system RelE/ParE family toxin [Bacteroidota bacterium]